jgi:hypothetical protein
VVSLAESKEVTIWMGMSMRKFSGADTVKGKVVAIDDSWLKLVQKKESVSSISARSNGLFLNRRMDSAQRSMQRHFESEN